MINEQTLTELEGWLGYPLRDPSILMRTEGSDTAESRAAANVDLRAEFYRREHAYSFEEARPVRKQIICRHFAGLYVVNAVGPEEVVKGACATSYSYAACSPSSWMSLAFPLATRFGTMARTR